MAKQSIRNQVVSSVGRQWEEFAGRHPRLAEVLDEEVLTDYVVDRLEDDPAYQEAMADAQAKGRAAEAGRRLVDRFVGKFLRQLVGRGG